MAWNVFGKSVDPGKALKMGAFGPIGAPEALYNKLTQVPEIKVDPLDERYKTAVKDQTSAANRFRSELPSFKRDMYSSQADPTRAGLAGQIAGQRSNLSSRGLLYGGLRQGKEAGVHSGLAGQLGGFQRGANVAGDEQAQNYELAAIQQAQELRQMEQDRNQLENDLKVQQAQARKGALGSVLGGFGSALGGMFGSK